VPGPETDPRAQLAARLRLLRSFTDFPPGPPGSGPPAESLDAIQADLDGCTRCRLSQKRRTIVFGVGRADADIMFIGEGPGRDEDEQGEPFVGRAGGLLNEMIERCFHRRRADVYIANIVKCRPPGNRDPAEDEVATCLPFLKRQVASVRPRVICLLGKVAVQALFPGVRGIGAARGNVWEFAGIPVVPMFHPAYLLRARGERLHELKLQVLDDARVALEILERPGA
jgi:DNA polymerase